MATAKLDSDVFDRLQAALLQIEALADVLEVVSMAANDCSLESFKKQTANGLHALSVAFRGQAHTAIADYETIFNFVLNNTNTKNGGK